MNFRRPWVKLALLIAMVAVVSFLVPFTLAYVFDQTDAIVNTFAPPQGLNEKTAVEINVQKTVVNTGDMKLTPDGFRFTLEDVLTAEKLTVTSDEKGQAKFTLGFRGADAGKSFRFRVYEENDGVDDVIYSTAEYVVQIDMTLVDAKPVAAVQVNGKAVETCVLGFTNEYTGASVPATGDTAWLGLYAVLLLGGTAALVLVARRYRREN